MPNIPVFNAPEPDIKVSDLASESWAHAARTIGELGREGAEDTRRGFQAVATGLEQAGTKLQENQEAKEHLAGIQSLTAMKASDQDQLTQILNGDPAQVESGLNQFRQDQAQRVSQWTNQFTDPKMKEWAAAQAGEYTLDQHKRFTADLSVAAANNAHNQATSTIGNIANSLGSNPTMQDISGAMKDYDEMTTAVLKNPNLSPEARQTIQKGLDADKSRIAILGFTKNPELAQPILQQYGNLLSPEQQIAIQGKINTDVGRQAGDDMIRSWTGGTTPVTTPHYAPGSTDGMTNATRAAAVLRNEYHWSDAAITGALNSVKTESNGQEWNNPGSAGEMGMYQFNPGSHLPLFQKAYGNDTSVENQTRYMAGWVNAHIPGYGTTNDPDQATAQFIHGFEAPRDQSQQAVAGRISNTSWSQAALAGLNNQKPADLPSGQAPAASAGTVAVGDSIAWGLIKHGGLTGSASSTGPGEHQTFGAKDTAAIGNSPAEILNQIKALPDDSLKGQSVVLSTGASNAKGDTSLVQQQIDALKAKGVTNITILGVGPRSDIAGANDKLAQLAKDNGLPFSGPLTQTGPDQVHPTKWGALAHSLPAQAAPTAAPAPASATPDINSTGDTNITGQAPAGTAPGGGVVTTPGAPAAATPPAKTTNQPAPGGGRPFPSLEDAIKNLPATLNPAQRDIAIEHLTRAHSQLTQMVGEERTTLVQNLEGGLDKLKNGQTYDFDEGQIRHYLEPKVADKIIGQLREASQIGKQIGDIRNSTSSEVITNTTLLQNSLKDTPPGDFKERKEMVDAYATAARQHLADLGVVPSEKPADPVFYIEKWNPQIAQAAKALDVSNPASVNDYVTKMLSWQDHLGLRPEQQHVLSIPQAQEMTRQIMQNPDKAADILNNAQTQWGPGYQHVWYDLTTLGKLPAQYQLLGALAPHDQAMLARALSEQSTAKITNTGDKGTEAYWEDTLGRTPGLGSNYANIKDTIREDQTVKNFTLSMRNSNASGEQVKSLVGAIDTLAFARTQYAGEAPDVAAHNAIEAALGHYDFTMPGSPRIPNTVAATVKANANQMLDGLNVNNIKIPDGVGGQGQPTADQYLSFLKNRPTWFTTPKEDALELVDGAGRLVRDTSGQPLTIKFGDAPAPQPQQQQPTNYPMAPF